MNKFKVINDALLVTTNEKINYKVTEKMDSKLFSNDIDNLDKLIIVKNFDDKGLNVNIIAFTPLIKYNQYY